MRALKQGWRHLQGHDCYSCEFSETFRSNGDGQVSRVHTLLPQPVVALCPATHPHRTLVRALAAGWR